jgi:hypothetical protein
MKRFILISAMVLMVLSAAAQSRETREGRRTVISEPDKKEAKTSEGTRRESAKMVNSRNTRSESTIERSGRASNQTSGKREAATSSPGRAVNQSSGKRDENASRSGSSSNQTNGRRAVVNQTQRRAVISSGETRAAAATRSSKTAVNSSHIRGYSHHYPGQIRTREVRVQRHVPMPAPREIRRINYVYRAPVSVEIYWTRRMHREYLGLYPFYRDWSYAYGSRILSIPAYDADYHVGRLRTVYGRVHEVYYAPESGLYYLYFGAPYPYHDFSIVISRREARRFTNRPVHFFTGQHVMVTGIIANYDGRPEIEVIRRSQLALY